MATDSEKQRYIDEMTKERGYVLEYHKVLTQQDFGTMVATNSLVDAVYLQQRSLDRSTKELIFVVTLTAMRASKRHIQSHIKAALDLGLTSMQILEALEILIPEAGVVIFQEGFDAWREMVNASGIEPTVPVFGSDNDN